MTKFGENKQVEFVWLFFIIIFSWILIDLWGKVINNFTYTTLRMNPEGTWDALIIACTVTAIFLVTLYYLGDTGDKLKENMTGVTPAEPFKESNMV